MSFYYIGLYGLLGIILACVLSFFRLFYFKTGNQASIWLYQGHTTANSWGKVDVSI